MLKQFLVGAIPFFIIGCQNDRINSVEHASRLAQTFDDTLPSTPNSFNPRTFFKHSKDTVAFIKALFMEEGPDFQTYNEGYSDSCNCHVKQQFQIDVFIPMQIYGAEDTYTS